jgi:hypothetical protein
MGTTCVKRDSAWKKSTYSGASGCIEIARGLAIVLVRDSKEPAGAVLSISAVSWNDFLTMVILSTKRPGWTSELR